MKSFWNSNSQSINSSTMRIQDSNFSSSHTSKWSLNPMINSGGLNFKCAIISFETLKLKLEWGFIVTICLYFEQVITKSEWKAIGEFNYICPCDTASYTKQHCNKRPHDTPTTLSTEFHHWKFCCAIKFYLNDRWHLAIHRHQHKGEVLMQTSSS